MMPTSTTKYLIHLFQLLFSDEPPILNFKQKDHKNNLNLLSTCIVISHGLRTFLKSHFVTGTDFGKDFGLIQEALQKISSEYIITPFLAQNFSDQYLASDMSSLPDVMDPEAILDFVFNDRNNLTNVFTLVTDIVSSQDPCKCKDNYRKVISSNRRIHVISIPFNINLQNGLDDYFTDNFTPMEKMGDCDCYKEDLNQLRETVVLEAPQCFFLKVNRKENEFFHERRIEDTEKILFLHMKDDDEVVPYIVIAGLMRPIMEGDDDKPYRAIVKVGKNWYAVDDPDRFTLNDTFCATSDIDLCEYFLFKQKYTASYKPTEEEMEEIRKQNGHFGTESYPIVCILCSEDQDSKVYEIHQEFCNRFFGPFSPNNSGNKCTYCDKDFSLRDLCLQHMYKVHVYPLEKAQGTYLREEVLAWSSVVDNDKENHHIQLSSSQGNIDVKPFLWKFRKKCLFCLNTYPINSQGFYFFFHKNCSL